MLPFDGQCKRCHESSGSCGELFKSIVLNRISKITCIRIKLRIRNGVALFSAGQLVDLNSLLISVSFIRSDKVDLVS